MTIEQYQKLYSFSVTELKSKCFKNFQSNNLKDYIDKSMSYILQFGLDKNNNSKNLGNAIDLVRKQISFMIAEKQLANNPDDLANMQTQDAEDVKEFLVNPVDYITTKLKDDEYYNLVKPKNIEGLNENDNTKYSNDLDEARKRLTELLSTEVFRVKYNGTENKKTYAKDVYDQINKKLGNSTIQNELRRCKPGFWERIRGKTSIQYKTFKRTMEGYTDKRNPDIGDREALETAAINYLRHKFPHLQEGELPTIEQINRLGSTSKKRATLCLKVALSCREVKQAIKLTGAVRGLNQNNNLVNENDINTNVINNNLVNENEINTNLINNNLVNENEINTNVNNKELKNESNEIKEEAKPKKKGGLKKTIGNNNDKPKKKVGFSKTVIVGSSINPKKDEEALEDEKAPKEPTEVTEEETKQLAEEALKKPTMKFEEVQVKKDPKRYVNERGKLVGGKSYIAKYPEKAKIYWKENHKRTTEQERIFEEEQLKKDSLLDDQKKLAEDNNEFLNELKEEVKDNAVENNNQAIFDNIEVNENEIKPIEN